MCGLCLFWSLDEADLFIPNSKYRNKVSRGESRTAVSYSVPLPPAPITCVCPSVEARLGNVCVCVGLCQKVYPIITDGYHYHFLHFSSPFNPANVNIQLKDGSRAEPSFLPLKALLETSWTGS